MKRSATTYFKNPEKKQRVLIEIELESELQQLAIKEIQEFLNMLLHNEVPSHNNGNFQADVAEYAEINGCYVTPSLIQLALSASARNDIYKIYWGKNAKATPLYYNTVVDTAIGLAFEEDKKRPLTHKDLNTMIYNRIAQQYKKDEMERYHQTMAMITSIGWGQHVDDMIALEALESDN